MMIAGLHDIIAFAARAPEMSLEKEEADLLAKTTVPVLAMFDVAPDPRILAVVALAGAVAQIEGPRIMLIKMRLDEEKRAARARPVYDSPNPAPTPQGPGSSGFTPFEPLSPGSVN